MRQWIMDKIIIIIMIMIAFKRRCSRYFLQFFTVLRIISNTYAQAAEAQWCENHMQHMERSSPATCRVQRGTKGQLSNYV